MDSVKVKDFIETYCDAPPEPESQIVLATKEEIIDNFISTIKNLSVDTHNLIKYKMPDEFVTRIDKVDFWRFIISFIDGNMGFEDYNLGEHKSELVFDSEYKYLGYRQYFLVSEKVDPDYPNYHEDWVAIDINKVNKIVFRIYKK